MPVKNRLEHDYDVYYAPHVEDEYIEKRGRDANIVLSYIPFDENNEVYNPQELSPSDWNRLAQSMPEYWDKIVELGEALKLGYERREKSHSEQQQGHDSYYRDDMLTQWALPRETESLLNLILWARTPQYYKNWDISEENAVIYSELTNLRIFTDESDTDIFEGSNIWPVNVIERVLNHNLKLKPSVKPEEN